MAATTAEERRLEEALTHQAHWRRWGPYLSDRQWGTVREDYSSNGTAWDYFPHDQARARTYRWGEEGIAGISDNHQRLCFALAFWNGEDSILKERFFGLTGNEGNHGEDVKEYYFYLDNTPTHSYMKMLYKYPHQAFPYTRLVEENKRRNRREPEFELLDTGIFEGARYFDVFVDYAKQSAEDILMQIKIINRGTETKTLHLLPTLWFRNTWSWNGDDNKPILQSIRASNGLNLIEASHPTLGKRWLYCQGATELLFTENETNTEKLFGSPNVSAYVKDGINDYIVQGKTEAVNPDQFGTKASAYYWLAVGAGETKTIQLRLSDTPNLVEPFSREFDAIFSSRQQEADEFYQRITPFP
ncbi:MAG: MGH1-like glycoside hydrolase domain-containing protein, partial [Microcystaceae cyanobacterium]